MIVTVLLSFQQQGVDDLISLNWRSAEKVSTRRAWGKLPPNLAVFAAS
jgi:hypothetical protein